VLFVGDISADREENTIRCYNIDPGIDFDSFNDLEEFAKKVEEKLSKKYFPTFKNIFGERINERKILYFVGMRIYNEYSADEQIKSVHIGISVEDITPRGTYEEEKRVLKGISRTLEALFHTKILKDLEGVIREHT